MTERAQGKPREITCDSDQMVITVANQLKEGNEVYVLLPVHGNIQRLRTLTHALNDFHVSATLLANQQRNGTEYYMFHLIKHGGNR